MPWSKHQQSKDDKEEASFDFLDMGMAFEVCQ